MANWKGLVLTDAGRALDAATAVGTQLLEFTKIKLGKGKGVVLETMTDLAEPVQSAVISEKAVVNTTTCQLTAVVSNADVSESYFISEFGIFAKDKLHPDEPEILYAIMVDDAPDYFKAAGGELAQNFIFRVLVGTQNAAKVVANIDPGGLLTWAALEQHNNDVSAHGPAFDAIKKLMSDTYLPKAGGTVTGNLDIQGILSAITPPTGDNSTRVPTTAWVHKKFENFRLDSNGLYVPKTGGAITGDLDVQGNLSVITQTLEDYGVNAANTKWVQDFVKNYVGSSGAVRASYGETGFRVFNDGFCIQWGKSSHGYVTFPIAYKSNRVIITNHQGTTFFQTKVREYNSLSGFTLDVEDNIEKTYDSQWIAMGY